MDVIRIDVLLHALGGFAEPPKEAVAARALPELLWREIDRLAAMPKAPHGAVQILAKRWGRTPNSIAWQIGKVRKRKYRAQYRVIDKKAA